MTDTRDRVTLRGRPVAAAEPAPPEPEPEEPEQDQEPSSPTKERPTPRTDLIGKQWKSQYVIEELLAEGGMGEIWLARSADTGDQPVVVKTLPPEQRHNREAVDRLLREARVLAALDDPNVVQLFDTGRLEDGRPVLVMEYVKGPSVTEIVEAEGPLSLERVCKHMLQTCSALHEAHTKGIVHRDIKPSNLVVTTKWARADFIKVIDYGIVKPSDPELAGKMRTRTKAIVGSAGFIAPEQALAKPIDAKADIYGLGVVLYYELTGRLPYEGDTFLAVVGQQISGGPFPAPIELRPDTPLVWNALVLDCVQLDPKKRPTALEFANRIARGWPDGKALMRVLATKIAVLRGPSSPHAATMPGDVATAFTRLSSLHTVPTLPTKRWLPTVLALIVAALCGGLATFLVMHVSSAPDATEAIAESPRDAPKREESNTARNNAGPPAPQDPPANGSPGTSAAIPLDARVDDGSAATATRSGSGAGSGTTTPTPPALPRDPRPDEGSAKDRSAAPEPPSPAKRKPASSVNSNVLEVRAKPFANVEIDGVLVGEAPPTIRKTLKPGTHTIRLIGRGGEVRTVTRTVGTGPLEPVYEDFGKP